MLSEFVSDHREEIIERRVLRTGTFGIQGSTGQVLGHELVAVRARLHRSLTEVRLSAGIARPETIAVAGLLEDLEVSALVAARARKLRLSVAPIDPKIAAEADR